MFPVSLIIAVNNPIFDCNSGKEVSSLSIFIAQELSVVIFSYIISTFSETSSKSIFEPNLAYTFSIAEFISPTLLIQEVITSKLSYISLIFSI